LEAWASFTQASVVLLVRENDVNFPNLVSYLPCPSGSN